MYTRKANIYFLLKIATELFVKGDNLDSKYYKEVFRAFKKFNKTGEHYYYKVMLTDKDLERFDIKYLFFKNDLTELEIKFKVIRMGDLFKEYKLYHDYKRVRTFDNVILFKRFLDHDKLYNVIYVNKRQLKFLQDLTNRNNLKWFKPSEDKLLKEIRQTPRRTKTDWEEEQEENPTNNYNQNWEIKTTIEDFLPCDTTKDKIRYKQLDRLI